MSLMNPPRRARPAPGRRGALLLAAVLPGLLSGCFDEKAVSLSYLAVNHTDESIVSFTIDGDGGILNVPSRGGGGGEVCCVTLPAKWRPGLKVAIRWENDGDWLKDANGQEVIRDGKRVYVPRPWKERTVEIAEYQAEDLEHFDVHFLPGDEVIAKPSFYFPWHPDYRPRYPAREKDSPHR